MVMVQLPVESGGGGGGDITNGLNVNVGGIGVFSAKSGATLQFRGVDAGSSKIAVTLDAGTQRILVDVTEANLSLQNLGGLLTVAKGGTNSSTALNSNRIMVSAAGSIVEAAAMTNGQLLIGSTGAAPVVAAILGTANQVSVTLGAGSIQLALPQNIHSGASPTFAGLTLTAFSGIVRATAGVLSASAQVDLTTEVTGILPAANGGTGANDGVAKLVVSKAAVTVGTRRQVNFIEGTGVTLTIADNIGTDSVDVTITANTATAGLTYITLNNESGSLANSRQITVGPSLKTTDAGAGSTLTIEQQDCTRFMRFFFEDFVRSTATSSAFTGTSAGTGANDTYNDSDVDRPGVAQLSTGTTATGRSSLNIAANSAVVQLGGGTMAVTSRFATVLNAISDGTNTYTARIGFGDSATNTESTDFVGFRYTHTESGGNWSAVTRSNDTETVTSTAVPPVGGTYQRFKIEVNAAGTSVGFYINETLVATNTTNIPTGSARSLGPMFQIVKSVGLTARTLRCDYVCIDGIWSSAR